jgi:hypothetical protein
VSKKLSVAIKEVSAGVLVQTLQNRIVLDRMAVPIDSARQGFFQLKVSSSGGIPNWSSLSFAPLHRALQREIRACALKIGK